jgi:tetratricopeptide (TPR) repeat protein
MLYYTHNLHFLAIARYFEGKNNAAQQAIDVAVKQVDPQMIKQMPMAQFITGAPLQLLVGSESWNEILSLPRPDSFMNATLALWYWARALAYLNRNDFQNVYLEQKQFNAVSNSIPSEQVYGYNPAKDILAIANNILMAKISEHKKDVKQAETYYTKATGIEIKLHYNEPPDWFIPTYNMLGGFYLRNGMSAQAEAAFRSSLKQYPNNGRGLYGLQEALKAQNKNADADKVKADFDIAWKNADKPLTVQDL